MHANIEQLLEIKDGFDNQMTAHVEECEQCQAELAYLGKLSQQLFDAHDYQPGDEHWQRIAEESGLLAGAVGANNVGYQSSAEQSRAHQKLSRAGTQNSSLSRSIYTLAASVMFVGLVSIFMISQQNSVRQQANQMQASINQLMMNSQGLENVLQQVVVRDERLTPEDQAAAERLYWKLTYVDQALHTANPELPEEAERIKILWSDRVEVLNELNRLFYQRKDALEKSQY